MRQLVRQPNGATWIAEDDRRMCGFAIVEWSRKTAELTAYIQTIEVVAERRGQGVGGELLWRIEASASDAGIDAIWLHVDSRNAGAIRLYEKRKFQLRGSEEDYYGRGRAALIYAKPLVAAEWASGKLARHSS